MNKLEFKYLDKTWQTEVSVEGCGNIPLYIISDEDVLDPDVRKYAEEIVCNISSWKSSSEKYAYESAYKGDVEEEGDLFISSVQIRNDQEFDVWFVLGYSGRYLGVKYLGERVRDIYCDAP